MVVSPARARPVKRAARRSSPLIVALDVSDLTQASELVRQLLPYAAFFKVGAQLFTGYGPEAIAMVRRQGARVFLDLKFHDIPSTVAKATAAATHHRVSLMTLHTSGGVEMLRAGAQSAAETAARLRVPRPKLVGVTVLTSVAQQQFRAGTDPARALHERVLTLAGQAKEAGLDGVVASAEEARLLRERFGKRWLVITPGIRQQGSDRGEQARVLTPCQALQQGADYLVIGRPIVAAPDPVQAARAILEEITSCPL